MRENATSAAASRNTTVPRRQRAASTIASANAFAAWLDGNEALFGSCDPSGRVRRVTRFTTSTTRFVGTAATIAVRASATSAPPPSTANASIAPSTIVGWPTEVAPFITGSSHGRRPA